MSNKLPVVVDTNVPIVSNGHTPQASLECRRTCISMLNQIKESNRVVLDDRGLIMAEYRKKLSFAGQPGLGDAFFKWVHENQANLERCLKVRVVLDEARGFREFPDDPALDGFDPDDRKFVAVALASGLSPTIYDATDPGWWDHRVALQQAGVNVYFLCPELMVSE